MNRKWNQIQMMSNPTDIKLIKHYNKKRLTILLRSCYNNSFLLETTGSKHNAMKRQGDQHGKNYSKTTSENSFV